MNSGEKGGFNNNKEKPVSASSVHKVGESAVGIVLGDCIPLDESQEEIAINETEQTTNTSVLKKLDKTATPEFSNEILDLSEAPRTSFTINSIADKFGFSYGMIKKIAKDNNIGRKYGNSKNYVTLLTEEEKDYLYVLIAEKQSVLKAPEGYKTARAMANDKDFKALGIGKNTIQKTVDELKENEYKEKKFGSWFKDKSGANEAWFFSPEEQEIIKEKLGATLSPPFPRGYRSLNDIASELSMDPGTLEGFIRKKMPEIGLNKYRSSNGKDAFFFSPREIKYIEDKALTRKNYATAHAIATNYPIKAKTLEKLAKENGISGSEFKGTIYYSSEDVDKIEKIRDDYLDIPLPPEGFYSVRGLSQELGVSKDVIESRIEMLGINGKECRYGGNVTSFYSLELWKKILESTKNIFSKTSIPENTVAFYAERVFNIEQNIRPIWMKNPDTGRNLELDIFIPELRIGIEYDGVWSHKDWLSRDIAKDRIARENGIKIIHIREYGCPRMPDDSICINRKNNSSKADLNRCLKECFKLLNVPGLDIDVVRDDKDIKAFMRQRVLDRLDSAKSFDELSVAS